MKLALLTAWLALPLLLTGCPSAQLQNAAQASENAAIIVQGLETAEIAAHGQGLIPDADHLFIQQQVQSLAAIGKTVDACIGGAGTTKGAVACLQTAVTQVQQIQANGGLYLKSTTAKNDFSVAMSGVEGVLTSVEIMLNGTPAATPAATTSAMPAQ